MARLKSEGHPTGHSVLAFLVYATICTAAYAPLPGDETRQASVEQTTPRYSLCYFVADLVLPIGKPQFSETGEREPPDSSKPDFETLMDLIKKTVNPDGWQSNGGTADMQSFGTNLSLVINAHQRTHEAVAALLEDLRELQDTEVRLETQIIETSPKVLSRLGIAGKQLVTLSRDERQKLEAAVTADPRGRRFAGQRAVIFSGQQVSYIPQPEAQGAAAAEYRVQGVTEGNEVRMSLLESSAQDTLSTTTIAACSTDEAIILLPPSDSDDTKSLASDSAPIRFVMMTAAREPVTDASRRLRLEKRMRINSPPGSPQP